MGFPVLHDLDDRTLRDRGTYRYEFTESRLQSEGSDAVDAAT